MSEESTPTPGTEPPAPAGAAPAFQPCPHPEACHQGTHGPGKICQAAMKLKDGSVVCFAMEAMREQARLNGRYHELLDRRKKAAAEAVERVLTAPPGMFPGLGKLRP